MKSNILAICIKIANITSKDLKKRCLAQYDDFFN